jgi:hypothetical protein
LAASLSKRVCPSLSFARSTHSTPFFCIVTVDTYFRIFPKDTLRTKLLVSLVFSLGIVQSICNLVDGFRLFGSHRGDPSELTKLGLSWLSVIGLGAVGESSFNLRERIVL